MTASTTLFVRLRNSEGKYLAGGPAEVEFVEDIRKATVFDCRRDAVEQQRKYLRLLEGIVLEAVPVDPKEIYETCDKCGRPALSFQMFFDGECYVCESCRESRLAGRARL